jgi:hypothetical protein
MPIEFHRSVLYEEVWDAPLTRLGEKYGLSDNGLRKVCKALKVPLPAQGHWAKVAAGQTIPRTPLPKTDGPETYVSEPERSQRPFHTPEDDAWVADRIAFERQPENKIEVALPPSRWHEAVRPIRDKLKEEVAELAVSKRHDERESRRKPGERWDADLKGWQWRQFVAGGQMLWSRHKSTPIRVSLDTYVRGLAVLNTVCLAAKPRGFEARLDEEAGRIVLEGHQAKVLVRLTERMGEAWKQEQSAWEKKPRNVKYKMPSGELRLYVGESWSETAVSDKQGSPLETQLNAAFEAIYGRVVRALERQRESEDRERRWAEEARLREQAEARRREAEAARAKERRKREALLDEVSAWRTAGDLRRYLAAIEALPVGHPAGKSGEWLVWARSVADDLDPLAKGGAPE